MSTQDDWVRLDASETVTMAELCHTCGMTVTELEELIEFGALVPLETPVEGPVFSAEWVVPLRGAARLRSDFDLDVFTVGLLLGHLQRIDELEKRVRSLEAQLPGRARNH